MSIDLKQLPWGYEIDLKTSDKKIVKAIIAKTMVRPYVFNQIGAPPEAFPVHMKTDTTLTVPRFFMQRFFPRLIENTPLRMLKQGDRIESTFKGKLRPEQEPIIDAMLKALYQEGAGIINAPCGTGKTAMADYLITVLKKKALIIVHNEYLADQHIERLEQFTDCKVGIIRGKTIDVEGKDVVIGLQNNNFFLF